MSPLETSLRTPQIPASGPVRAARAVLRVVVGFGIALMHRREVTTLLDLDDRMLKDIGLVRSDIQGALAGSIGRDPSVVLRLRSVEHRARRRAIEAHVGRLAREGAAPARTRLDQRV